MVEKKKVTGQGDLTLEFLLDPNREPTTQEVLENKKYHVFLSQPKQGLKMLT